MSNDFQIMNITRKSTRKPRFSKFKSVLFTDVKDLLNIKRTTVQNRNEYHNLHGWPTVYCRLFETSVHAVCWNKTAKQAELLLDFYWHTDTRQVMWDVTAYNECQHNSCALTLNELGESEWQESSRVEVSRHIISSQLSQSLNCCITWLTLTTLNTTSTKKTKEKPKQPRKILL